MSHSFPKRIKIDIFWKKRSRRILWSEENISKAIDFNNIMLQLKQIFDTNFSFLEHCDAETLTGFFIYVNHRGSSKFHFRWKFFDVASIKALCKLRLRKTCGKREVGFSGFVVVAYLNSSLNWGGGRIFPKNHPGEGQPG